MVLGKALALLVVCLAGRTSRGAELSPRARGLAELLVAAGQRQLCTELRDAAETGLELRARCFDFAGPDQLLAFVEQRISGRLVGGGLRLCNPIPQYKESSCNCNRIA